MDPRYQEFCLADPVFYDALGAGEAAADVFGVHGRELPDGWRRSALEGWSVYSSPGAVMPLQGWKVHVSATTGNAEEIAGTVWSYCLEQGLPFKIVTGPRTYAMRNSKYGERAGSGKLATVYPADETALRTVLEELGALLDGAAGPYVLSDLRWKNGPLYVRYGAFLRRTYVDENGAVRSGIEDPQGNLVADPRGPVFAPPDWVDLPEFLQAELDRRNRLTVDAFPYEIVQALHFSNGGGVYEAKDPATGRRLVVKEARAYAGLDTDGQDAVTRLRNERDILQRLSGVPGVPAIVDYRTLAENEFLVQEFMAGTTLQSWYATRSPLLNEQHTREDITAYARWAEQVWDAVDLVLRSMHTRGVVYGDLHPGNILVLDDAGQPRVSLVDFEVSWPVERLDRRLTLGHPGFGAPPDRRGFAVDDYALAALRLASFVPLTTLVRLDRGKAASLADLISRTFPVPRSSFDEAVAVLSGTKREHGGPVTAGPGRTGGIDVTRPAERAGLIDPDHGAWPRTRESLAAAIAEAATPGRDDRLFPGDIAQFTEKHGGLGFAHGAAGVLWALHTSGAGYDPAWVRWLTDRVLRHGRELPPGFYDGAHGIAHALWDLGHHDEAVELVDRTRHIDPDRLDSGLYGGLSGIGLSLLAFAGHCGSAVHRARAEQVVAAVRKRLEERSRAEPKRAADATTPAGLMRGASGPALLLTAMYEATGDASCLDAAADALRLDLLRCVPDAQGVLQLRHGRRVEPYLNAGSTGVGFALRRWLAHRQDPGLAESLRAISGAARLPFYMLSGLFDGRSGMVLFHAADGPDNPGNPDNPDNPDNPGNPGNAETTANGPADASPLARQVQGLGWHAMSRQGHTVFPGNYLMRLSTDLATGSAGVLLALAAAHGVTHDGRPLSLPFLR